MKLINNRYEIIDILESDMYGNVYHVLDLQSENCPLRLKLLSLEMSDTEVVKYFKMNFINLVTIVHEHLLSNYEFEIVTSIDGVMSLKKQYFYTSEYYDRGEALSFSQLNSEERLSAIKQICYVLEYLHFRGVVYKFLSPMNLHVYKVDDEVRVKLLDVASMHSFATLLSAKEDYI